MNTSEIICGDCLEVMRGWPSESVDCCVTSPPYYGLRDYGVQGQLGLEPTPEQYIAAMVAVFEEVRRVLKPTGTLWLNIGDSYSGGGQGGHADNKASKGVALRTQNNGAKPKDLLMIPARLALALQAAGWYLRSDIIWAKPNPMPESVTDRPTSAHEHIFLLSKSSKYHYDADAIREDFADERMGNPGAYNKTSAGDRKSCNDRQDLGFINNGSGWERGVELGGRNARNVWTITTKPFPGAHFATFPPEIPRRCILAGCPPGGIVLDPFFGSGTVGMVAAQLGRQWVGIELNPEYVEIARKRTAQQGLFSIPASIDAG